MVKKKKSKTHDGADGVDPAVPATLPPLGNSARRGSTKESVFGNGDADAVAVAPPVATSKRSNSADGIRRKKRSSSNPSSSKESNIDAPRGRKAPMVVEVDVDPLASAPSNLSLSYNPTIPSAEARAQAIATVVNDINLDDICFKIVLVGDSGVGKSAVTFRFCDDVFFQEGAPTLGVDFKYARIETSERVPRTARLQIWDTAGQEAFLTLTTGFYRSAAGVVLCFDITNRMSFLHLDLWMQRIKDNCRRGVNDGQMPPIVLVGCKLDLARYDPFTFTSEGKDCPDNNFISNPSNADAKKSSKGKSLGAPQAGGAESVFEDGSMRMGGSTFCHRQVSQAEASAWCDANGVLCYFETSAKENSNVQDAFRYITTYIVQHTKMDTTKIAADKGGKGSGGGIFLRPKGSAASPDQSDKPTRSKTCSC